MSKRRKINIKDAQQELARREMERRAEQLSARGGDEPELAPVKKRKKKESEEDWATSSDDRHQRKLSRMARKKRLQSKWPVIAAIAGGLLFMYLGLNFLFRTGGVLNPRLVTVQPKWYYDIDASKKLAVEEKGLPPMLPKGRIKLYRAFVYGCGDCGNPQIAYLEGFSEPGRSSPSPRLRLESQDIYDLKSKTWLKPMSPAGRKFFASVAALCEGQGAMVDCLPTEEDVAASAQLDYFR
jgi:hypothetical protein